MAQYNPDWDYIKGKELLDNLKGEEGKLIRYVFTENENHRKRLEEKIKEMQMVFNGIRKFSNY